MRFPNFKIKKVILINGDEIVSASGKPFQMTYTYGSESGVGVFEEAVLFQGSLYKASELVIPITAILVVHRSL